MAPAAFFPVFTKALNFLAVFFPDLHVVGICPGAFVSQQGCGLASGFLLLSGFYARPTLEEDTGSSAVGCGTSSTPCP